MDIIKNFGYRIVWLKSGAGRPSGTVIAALFNESRNIFGGFHIFLFGGISGISGGAAAGGTR